MPTLFAFDCEGTGVSDTDTLTCIVATIRHHEHDTTETFHSGATLSSETACAFVDRMWQEYTNHDATILSYNGIGYDFKKIAVLLADFPDRLQRLKQMAMDSVDIMLDFTTEHGYYTSLQSFLNGCNLAGKTQSGAWAATAWEKEPDTVLAYCTQDVAALLALWEYRVARGYLFRLSKRGSKNKWVPQAPVFRKAQACIFAFEQDPVVPDWMASPPDIPSTWRWLVEGTQ